MLPLGRGPVPEVSLTCSPPNVSVHGVPVDGAPEIVIVAVPVAMVTDDTIRVHPAGLLVIEPLAVLNWNPDGRVRTMVPFAKSPAAASVMAGPGIGA